MGVRYRDYVCRFLIYMYIFIDGRACVYDTLDNRILAVNYHMSGILIRGFEYEDSTITPTSPYLTSVNYDRCSAITPAVLYLTSQRNTIVFQYDVYVPG